MVLVPVHSLRLRRIPRSVDLVTVRIKTCVTGPRLSAVVNEDLLTFARYISALFHLRLYPHSILRQIHVSRFSHPTILTSNIPRAKKPSWHTHIQDTHMTHMDRLVLI